MANPTSQDPSLPKMHVAPQTYMPLFSKHSESIIKPLSQTDSADLFLLVMASRFL